MNAQIVIGDLIRRFRLRNIAVKVSNHWERAMRANFFSIIPIGSEALIEDIRTRYAGHITEFPGAASEAPATLRKKQAAKSGNSLLLVGDGGKIKLFLEELSLADLETIGREIEGLCC